MVTFPLRNFLVTDLMVVETPPRSVAQALQLLASGILAVYAVLWVLFAIFVAPRIADRLLAPALVAILLISLLHPVRPILRRRWQTRRHRAR